MLSDGQLAHHCQDRVLSEQAQAVIAAIPAAPPSRRVRGAAGNVSVRYASRKIGVAIQAESHRNELAGVCEKEHDPATPEYYDQPPPIKLVYPAASGRRVGVWHTPDYFVLRTDAVGWEEWKSAEELERLVAAMPHRCRRREDGRWWCPPGEAYARPLGLSTGSAPPPRSTGCSSATSSSWRTTCGPTAHRWSSRRPMRSGRWSPSTRGSRSARCSGRRRGRPIHGRSGIGPGRRSSLRSRGASLWAVARRSLPSPTH
jgi:hypothetical protein